ncbi:hypothetical protein PPYR_10557 [Photinus pyralis]|uniref:Mitochondrial inner membrane protein Mpv17 n=1 Tax=Photinus pyralis TaxID=7054 RepID=A0A5N4AGT3_PHOPY|nr:protein Mpv17 [Photinus pyralis]KAB0796496.1 hypothetical protein PPYR_10557 [Photinus pyralis]
MTTILRLYKTALKKYPLITSSLQTSGLTIAGDILAQTAVEGNSLKNINLLRTSQFGAVGLFLVGPTLTTWYRFLDKCLGNKGASAVLKKVAFDQGLFAPSFIVVFLTSLAIVQQKNIKSSIDELKMNYKDILITNYKLWPLVQLGNFYIVPVQYQILVVQFVAIIWNTYLSWKTQGSKFKE